MRRAQIEAAKPATLNGAHLQILRQYGGKHGERLLAAVAAGQVVAPLLARGYRRLRRREDFTITVPSTDDVYPALHEWVLARMPETDRKAMIATSVVLASRRADAFSDVPPIVRLRYDGNREQQVAIEGHRVNISATIPLR